MHLMALWGSTVPVIFQGFKLHPTRPPRICERCAVSIQPSHRTSTDIGKCAKISAWNIPIFESTQVLLGFMWISFRLVTYCWFADGNQKSGKLTRWGWWSIQLLTGICSYTIYIPGGDRRISYVNSTKSWFENHLCSWINLGCSHHQPLWGGPIPGF